jgi:TP901 family phage tail tape measure protein
MSLQLATAYINVKVNRGLLDTELNSAVQRVRSRLGSLKLTVLITPKINQTALNSIMGQLSNIGAVTGGVVGGGSGGSDGLGGGAGAVGRGGSTGRGGGSGIGGVNMGRNESLMSGASRVATGRALFSGKVGGFLKGSAQIATGILGAQAALSAIETPIVAVKEYADFTSEMTRLRATTQATAGEFKTLESVVKKTAVGTKFTLVETADAAASLAQMGVSTQDMPTMLPRALEFATATRINADEASRILLETMNQMDLTAAESERAADVMSRFSVKTAADVRSLGSAMSYTGRFGKELGLEIEEVGGAIAFLAKAGLRGSRGGTALKNIFASFADADTMDKAKKILGEDFTLTIKNAKGEFVGFPAIIAQFESKIKGSLDPMQTMNLLVEMFNRRGAPGFAAMLSAGSDELRKFEQIAYDTSITTQGLAAEQMDNLTGAIQELQTTFSKAMVESVEPFSEGIIDIVDNLKEVVSGIPDVVDGVRRFGSALKQTFGQTFSPQMLDILTFLSGGTAGVIGGRIGQAVGNTSIGGILGRYLGNLFGDIMYPESAVGIGIESTMTQGQLDAAMKRGPNNNARRMMAGQHTLFPSRANLMLGGGSKDPIVESLEEGNDEERKQTKLLGGFTGIENLSKKIQQELFSKEADQKRKEIASNTKKTYEEISKLNRDGIKIDGSGSGAVAGVYS